MVPDGKGGTLNVKGPAEAPTSIKEGTIKNPILVNTPKGMEKVLGPVEETYDGKIIKDGKVIGKDLTLENTPDGKALGKFSFLYFEIALSYNKATQ